MTKKATAVVAGLSLLTLGGFIVVSQLAGKYRLPPAPKPLQARQDSITQPKTTLSPQLPGKKSIQAEIQWRNDLNQAQSLLEQIVADLSAGNWPSAQTHFDEFAAKTRQLPAGQLNHPESSPVMQDFLALYKIQLARALKEQNVRQGRFCVNQLFAIVGEQRARFSARSTPLEFQRLRFLLREIEMWSETDDTEMLKVRLSALDDTWQDIRPIIAARRGGTDHVSAFDALMKKLSAASQSAELTALLPQFNEEMDKINNLFQRPPRASGSPFTQPGNPGE